MMLCSRARTALLWYVADQSETFTPRVCHLCSSGSRFALASGIVCPSHAAGSVTSTRPEAIHLPNSTMTIRQRTLYGWSAAASPFPSERVFLQKNHHCAGSPIHSIQVVTLSEEEVEV